MMQALRIAFGLALLLWAAPAQLQPYPSKPIRLYVAGAEGSGIVAVSRSIAGKLAEALGQPVSVELHPGLTGGIAAGIATARASPDGHTLLMGGSGTLATNPAVAAAPKYDPVRDFSAVSLVGTTPYLLIASPTLAATSLSELITLAKSQPGRISFATQGMGNNLHLGIEQFQQVAGIKLRHVPYETPGGGVTALLAGEGQLAFSALQAVAGHLPSGRLKVLAATSSTRLPTLPSVPTAIESGLTGFELGNWYGIVAPAATPEPIVLRLRGEIARILAVDDLKAQARKLGIEPAPGAGPDFAALLKREWEKWSRVVEESGMRAQIVDNVRRRAALASDLEFARDARPLGRYSDVANQLFKPAGAGPFPAIVYLHTCGGIDFARNRYWTEAALQRGYAVLVVDSLGPRGVRTLCDTFAQGRGGVNTYRGLKDAVDALEHLAKLPYIDAKRVSLVGFSWGAGIGMFASSSTFGPVFSPRRFAAVAAFYGFCGSLRHDTDVPLIVLMGAADDETPPSDCIATLTVLKPAGAPVDWELYSGATHSWDTDREIVKTTNRGIQVRYVPNPKVTDESARRLFAFLDARAGSR